MMAIKAIMKGKVSIKYNSCEDKRSVKYDKLKAKWLKSLQEFRVKAVLL